MRAGAWIDADFRRSGHVVLASAPGHAAGFEDAARALDGLDMPAHALAREDLREEVGSDAFFGGLVVERSGGLHPGKLVAGLVRLAGGRGRDAPRGRPRAPRPATGRRTLGR